jgi:hypothetical protein
MKRIFGILSAAGAGCRVTAAVADTVEAMNSLLVMSPLELMIGFPGIERWKA